MFLPSARARWHILSLVFIFLFLFIPYLYAQRRGVENLAEGPSSFFVDHANFFDPESNVSRLEVFYMVANDHLQFVKEEDGYRASFQALCVVYDHKGRQVTGDELSNSQWVKLYDETNSRREFAQGKFRFFLSPGEYRVLVWIEGQRSGKIVSKESRVRVPSFEGDSLMLSDLLFVENLDSTENRREPLADRGLLIVPSVRRTYSDERPQISVYFEVYDFVSHETIGPFYEVVLEAVDMRGEVSLADTSKVRRRGRRSLGRKNLLVSSLEEEGEYLLRLRVRDPKTDRTAQGERSFVVRFSSLSRMENHYEEAIEQLRYIATEQEYKKLKAAQGDERKEAWLEFWAQRDPTPGTPENEMKDEFYRRVEYANDHFSVVSPGWKSDRGRIYIMYGRPDEIERHPMEVGLKPYEIWHYYSSSHYFYFIDENGYGEYRLVSWR